MYVLGIDAGATKTDCFLADETGEILCRARGPGANLQICGEDEVEGVLGSVIDEALSGRAAGADALCIGIAGADRQHETLVVKSILERIGRSRSNLVTNDAVIALVAGAGERYGVVLTVGTGATGYGINRAGKVARAGGWGYLFGDEGSAYWMGLRTLQAVARAADGRGRKTLLTPRVLDSLGVSSPESLIPRVYRQHAREEVARLARVVQEAADLGDEAAQEILDEASRELVRSAESVIGKLEMAGEPFRLVLAGGLWKAAPVLRDEVSRLLSMIAPRAVVQELRVDAAVGAIQLALESLP
jgi:N-acetylglucosamine kinase-like BadF-type ATPase